MPSFLSKVFGRKKEDAADGQPLSKAQKSDPSLLEGKFEAVPTPSTPIATNFAEASREKDNKEGGFALFRTKSRQPHSPLSSSKKIELPTLSLNFPGQKDENGSRALGVVFEGDRQVVLDESVIGARRLTPSETLALVKACSQVITERGLETLGIMHPHWHSASPEIQQRLISLFIQSLTDAQNSTSKNSTSTPFDAELKFTRSPHDVAAVLRWGLRHLKLDGSSFGKDSAEWSWYQDFSGAERAANYPPKAFSEKLTPLLPKPHLELLLATLEIEASLAAHAEHNSISGSKLSKFLGLWLLSASRSEVNDDWEAFYARWERAGRILEHLFLSRIRDESVNHRMPTRLSELVNHYPYGKASEQDELLPRPRFSTRPHDALFVRIDTEISSSTADKPKRDRLRLLSEAFKQDLVTESGDYVEVWDKVKRAAMESTDEEDTSVSKDSPVLNRIFADETIRLLSLIPANGTESPINLISPSIARPPSNRRRSRSLSRIPDHKGTNGSATNGISIQTKAAATPLPPSPLVDIDWAQFSSAGFGEASSVGKHLSSTLLDKDLETTRPSMSRKLSRSKRNRDGSRRSSVDSPNPASPNSASSKANVATLAGSKATLVNIIQLDEAFIDFWSDAALDPISSSWPTFVVCKLNFIPGVQSANGKPINWLVIEQTYSTPPVPRSPSPESPSKRTSSPRPSLRSELNSTFSATRKRFSFFGGSNTVSSGKVEKTKSRKPSLRTPKIGELGEILPDVEEKSEAKNGTTTAGGVDGKELTAITGPGADEVIGTSKPEDKIGTTAAKNVAFATTADPAAAKANGHAKAEDKVDGVVAEGAGVGPAIADPVELTQQGNTVDTAPAEGVDTEEPTTVEQSDIAKTPTPKVEETTLPTGDLPPAPENVVLSGETPGPQLALDTSEPTAIAQTESFPVVAEPERTSVPVDDAPGPQTSKDTEPATFEPLKDQGETASLPVVDEVPVIPVTAEPILKESPPVTIVAATESPTHGATPVAEAASETDPIEPASSSPISTPAPVDSPEVAPVSTEEPTTDADEQPSAVADTTSKLEAPLEAAHETVPEEAQDKTLQHIAEAQQPPVDVPTEPETAPEATSEVAPEEAQDETPKYITETQQPLMDVPIELETLSAGNELPTAEPVKELAPEALVEAVSTEAPPTSEATAVVSEPSPEPPAAAQESVPESANSETAHVEPPIESQPVL